MSVLLEISEAETSAKKSAQVDYRNIIIRLAAGDDDPTLDEVKAVLALVGKTPYDLAASVSNHKARDAKRQIIDDAAKAHLEGVKLEKQLADALTILNAAKETYRQTLQPIHYRLGEILQLQQDAANARMELKRGCDDPEVLEQMNTNRSQLESIGQLVREARQHVGRLEQVVAVERREGPRGPISAQSRLDSAQSALSELHNRRQQLLNESNELVEAMIDA